MNRMRIPSEVDTLIVGGGPTGLGAALRLQEHNEYGFLILDCNAEPGGLARTVKTAEGFLFDLGGHITFSHYKYFDESLQRILGEDDWMLHQRASHILYGDTLVPYPFQNNLGRLPPQDQEACLMGMVNAAIARAHCPKQPISFQDWMDMTLGDGIVKLFLNPYATKVWAISPSKMQCKWLGDRVPAPNLAQAIHSVVSREEDESWGPNTKFKFPTHNGTGNIWRAFADLIPESKKIFGKEAEVTKINLDSQVAHLANGSCIKYGQMISTMPLTTLGNIASDKELQGHTNRLRYSSTHIVGIGLRGQPPKRFLKTYWVYFHEEKYIFNRVTIFSNYSPNNQPGDNIKLPTIHYGDARTPNVSQEPQPGPYWSVLAEISESKDRPVLSENILGETLRGLIDAKILDNQAEVVSKFYQLLPFGYPTPTLERDDVLAPTFRYLEARNLYSRGRFGGWKYEVGNQDHSFMQGVEIVDRIVKGTEETTFENPDMANSGIFKK